MKRHPKSMSSGAGQSSLLLPQPASCGVSRSRASPLRRAREGDQQTRSEGQRPYAQGLRANRARALADGYPELPRNAAAVEPNTAEVELRPQGATAVSLTILQSTPRSEAYRRASLHL